MTERYPDPDERSNEYKKMYFEQGSAHSGSRNVLFNSIILIKTFKAWIDSNKVPYTVYDIP